MSAHQATLIPEWGPTTFFLNGGAIEPELAAKLDERGVTIEPEPVNCLVGEGTSLSAIRLRNGVEQPIDALRSDEHTSELQSLMRISYAVFCLKKKQNEHRQQDHDHGYPR